MVKTVKRSKKLDKIRDRAVSRFLVSNFLTTRAKLAEQMRGGWGVDPPGRDLDYECGYPVAPSIETFRRLYDREAYARRVNDIWPDECWAIRPELYETEDSRVTKFERAWKRLNQRINVWHYLHRADRLSGIGCFGVILLGFDDGRALDKPVRGVDLGNGNVSAKRPKKATNLVYVRVFSEESVEISEIESNELHPRYGKPKYYEIQTSSPFRTGEDLEKSIRVHWTRIIHVADNTEDSDEVGTPRMLPVLNRLLDVRKILGGSAEMFWKGAFPGFSFETIPELVGEAVMNESSIKDQFEEYMEGLKRYLALDGVTAKPLFPQVADPTKHLEQQAVAICLALQIPFRIFLGSEAAHLASTQDVGTWNKRVSKRQTLYVEPFLIRPLVDRLIAAGVLPEPGEGSYMISWKDLNTMSDRDKADVSLKRAQAMMQYVAGGCETIMPPRQFYTLVLGLNDEEAQTVLDAVDKNKTKQLTDPLGDKAAARDAKLGKVVKPMGGGRIGNPARAPVGKPVGRIQQNRRNRRVRIVRAAA